MAPLAAARRCDGWRNLGRFHRDPANQGGAAIVTEFRIGLIVSTASCALGSEWGSALVAEFRAFAIIAATFRTAHQYTQMHVLSTERWVKTTKGLSHPSRHKKRHFPPQTVDAYRHARFNNRRATRAKFEDMAKYFWCQIAGQLHTKGRK